MASEQCERWWRRVDHAHSTIRRDAVPDLVRTVVRDSKVAYRVARDPIARHLRRELRRVEDAHEERAVRELGEQLVASAGKMVLVHKLLNGGNQMNASKMEEAKQRREWASGDTDEQVSRGKKVIRFLIKESWMVSVLSFTAI